MPYHVGKEHVIVSRLIYKMSQPFSDEFRKKRQEAQEKKRRADAQEVEDERLRQERLAQEAGREAERLRQERIYLQNFERQNAREAKNNANERRANNQLQRQISTELKYLAQEEHGPTSVMKRVPTVPKTEAPPQGYVRLHAPAPSPLAQQGTATPQVVLTAMDDNGGAKLESNTPLIPPNVTEDNRNEGGSNERNSGLHILFHISVIASLGYSLFTKGSIS